MSNQDSFSQPPPAAPAGYPPPQQPQSSGLATTSLVLGLFSYLCCGVAAVPAIVCGHMALSMISSGQAPESSRGMAVAGLVFAYVNLVITILLVLLYFLLVGLMVATA